MEQQLDMMQWQLDESSAEAYEQHLVPLLFAPGAQFLTELANLEAGERVLDVACGTGIVARTAAAAVGPTGKVVGFDRNESMLAVARRAAADIQPPIEWRQGDVTEIPYPAAAFDVVFCQQGLQFMPDQPAALREMHRVLAPGGRLAMAVLRSTHHNPGYEIFAQALERHVGPEAAMMMRSPFPDLSRDDLCGLVADAGFRDVKVLIGIASERYPSVEEFLQLEMASSPIGSQYSELIGSDEAESALIRDLSQMLRPYTDDAGIVFPAETHLVTAQR